MDIFSKQNEFSWQTILFQVDCDKIYTYYKMKHFNFLRNKYACFFIIHIKNYVYIYKPIFSIGFLTTYDDENCKQTFFNKIFNILKPNY